MGIMLLYAASVFALVPAATTVDKATRVSVMTSLSVQSGSNFIRIEPDHLPATVTYTPSSPFGPIPTAMVADKELTPSVIFSDCKTVWQWELTKTEKAAIMEIKAHESAVILVEPFVCPESTEMVAEVWDSIAWEGQTYTKSGDYTLSFDEPSGCEYTHTLHLTVHYTLYDTIPMTGCDSLVYKNVKYTAEGICLVDTTVLPTGDRQINFIDVHIHHSSRSEITVSQYEPYKSDMGNTYDQSGDYEERTVNRFGCDSVIMLHISILDHNERYDTVYFCRGFNKEHEERISDELVRRYLPYTYQSPAEWDYMEGAILETEHDRTLVDLARAESNLRNHYVNGRTPIDRVVWSVRNAHTTTYMPLEPGNQPQWIEAGKLAVQILFRCGEMYNNSYPMDVESIEAERTPVKRIENGHVVIMRRGEKYNILGIKMS